MVRVMVVNGNSEVRRWVCDLLDKESDFHTVCEAGDGNEAISYANKLSPDVVIIDIDLLDVDGIEAAKQIRQTRAETEVLFLSHKDSWDIAHRALEVGIGYVVKADADRELVAAVRAVAKHKTFLSSQLAAA